MITINENNIGDYILPGCSKQFRKLFFMNKGSLPSGIDHRCRFWLFWLDPFDFLLPNTLELFGFQIFYPSWYSKAVINHEKRTERRIYDYNKLVWQEGKQCSTKHCTKLAWMENKIMPFVLFLRNAFVLAKEFLLNKWKCYVKTCFLVHQHKM